MNKMLMKLLALLAVLWLAPEGVWATKSYLENDNHTASPDNKSQINNAKPRYTMNITPSISISPRNKSVEGATSIEPKVTVSAGATTRYFVYTLDGSEPILGGTEDVPVNGSSAVQSYDSSTADSKSLGVVNTTPDGHLTVNGVTIKDFSDEDDYVTLTIHARAVTNTGTADAPVYAFEGEEEDVEYKFFPKTYNLTVEPGNYTKNIGSDDAPDYLGVNAVNIKVSVELVTEAPQSQQEEKGAAKKRKFYIATPTSIKTSLLAGQTVLYKVKNADGSWGPTMTVLPENIATSESDNVGYIRLYEKQNPSSTESEELKVWIEGREDFSESSKDVKYDITYSTSEAGYEDPLKTSAYTSYYYSPRKDFRVFVKYTGKETTAPDLYVYAQLATTDYNKYYFYPLTSIDGAKLEKQEDVKSISSDGTINDLGNWYVLQFKGYLPAINNAPGLFNIAVFDQAHKDKKYLFGQNAHNDMFIEYDGTTATDVTPTYTGQTSYSIFYNEDGSTDENGYFAPMQEVSPTGDDDKFAIINLDSYWTVNNVYTVNPLDNNKYVFRTDGVKIYSGENANGDPLANICYGSDNSKKYRLSTESDLTTYNANNEVNITDRDNRFAEAKELPFHAMYKIPMSSLSDGDKFTVKGFADSDPAITYTFRNGGVYIYDGKSDVSAEPVHVYAQHSEENAQSPDFIPNTISSTDDTDCNLLPSALGDRSSKIDVSSFSTLEYDEEEQLEYYSTNGNSDWIKTFDGYDASKTKSGEGMYTGAPNVLKLNNNTADNPLEIPVDGNYMPSTDITVQMLVRPVDTPTANVSAKLSVSCGENSKEASVTFGSETKGNVTADGRIDEYSEESANGDWRKLEVTVKGDGASVPTISVSGDADFYISNVTLLEDANTPGHFYTHAETGVDASSLDLSDRSKANAFSFFDRGDNKNAIVFVSDKTVLGGAKDGNVIPAGDGQNDNNNQLKKFTATGAQYNVAHGDGSTFTINTLKLTDTDGSAWENKNTFGFTEKEGVTVNADKVSYDRSYPANTRQTMCLPFALSSSELTDLGISHVYKFTGVEFHPETKTGTVNWVDVMSEGTEAGTPYIVEYGATPKVIDNVEIANKVIKGSAESTVAGNNTFTGVYSYQTIPVNANKQAPEYWGFVPGSSVFMPGAFTTDNFTTDIKPFRGYFHFDRSNTSGAKVFTFAIKDGGTVTEIDPTTFMQGDVNAPIYNISGQLVSNDGNRKALPRGIYIQNNKKFVVK